MDHDIFKNRFVAAYEKSVEFGQEFVLENLPRNVLFNLNLNASYDGNASSEFKLFPEDSDMSTGIRTKGIELDSAIYYLYRDGMVPQWVNLQLAGVTNGSAIVGIDSCGRFTADEELLYHQGEGWPPFHVLGPILPVGYKRGKRFSIFERSECWAAIELEYLLQCQARPWSLVLCGPEFTDDLLEGLKELDSIEILEFKWTAIAGKSLNSMNSIGCMPNLRVLRIVGGEQTEFEFSHLPEKSPSLTNFSFLELPRKIGGGSSLRNAFPNLSELTLASSQRVEWDHPPDLTGLASLNVSSPEFAPWVGSVVGTESISLTFDRCSNDEVFKVLNSGLSTLKSVNLRGTPVDNEVFGVLASMQKLEHFDVVDTKVDTKALKEFTAKRPDLSCWPKLK